MGKDNSKKNSSRREGVEKEILGKKFEDLTPEEMQKIQGSGDVSSEDIKTISSLIFSKPPYNCN